MLELGLGINLDHQIAAQQRVMLSPAQRQALKFHAQMEAWEHNPQEELPEEQVSKSISLSFGVSGTFNIGDFWKNAVRHQLLNLPRGEPVTVGITSTGSGAGKGSIAEGLQYFATQDLYMHTQALKEGFFVIPIVITFAQYMKAAQIPEKKGGPGKIDPNSGHGRFSADQYGIGSGFGQWMYDIHSSSRRKDARFFYIVEGSGTPWIKKTGARVKLDKRMPDRGASTVYNKPLGKGGKKYVLIADRSVSLGEQSKEIRAKYDPEAAEFSEVFRNGRDRFLLTDKRGKVKDVADMRPNIQRAVVELLRLSTAPPAAIERSDAEFNKMKFDLADEGVISGSSNEAYLRGLRDRLVFKGGYAEDEVLLIDNPWRGFNSVNDHHLDYFLRYNLVAQVFRKQLIPRPLRGTYMEHHPTHVYLGSALAA